MTSPLDRVVDHAKLKLETDLLTVRSREGVDDVDFLRAITFEMREILLDMKPRVERVERFSWFKERIHEHQERTGLTDLEVLEALGAVVIATLKDFKP